MDSSRTHPAVTAVIGRARVRAFARGVPLLLVVLVAGCGTRGGSVPEGTPKATVPDSSQVASLRSIGGSSLTGKITVADRGDRASLLVSVINLPVGAYRIVIHETPNCSSPNGFSAGRPWAPAAAAATPRDLIPTQYANSEAHVESELRVRGLHAQGPDGVAGRSVVMYAGPDVPDVRPDVPNAAIACGVFEPARSPF